MVLKVCTQKEVLLERADVALGAAIAFRGQNEGGRALDTEEGELALEGRVLTAVVVPDGETPGDVFAERPEATAHPLSDRPKRLEAGAAPGGVNADALGAVVVDGDEHGDLASPVQVVVMSVPHIVSTAS